MPRRKHNLDKKDFEIWFWLQMNRNGDSGCHEWTSTKRPSGYGQVWYFKRLHPAHRVAWKLKHGPIRKGLCVLHKCDNRICCNPDHLFLGTKKDNTHDMMKKGRQFTKLTPEVVAVIRHACKYEITHREIAKYFGISHGLVGHIRRGELWINR